MVALAELVPLTALLVVVGLILLIEALVKGLFRPLTGLPGVGGAIRSAENAIVHSLNSALGLAVSGIELIVGTSWHGMARFADWLWREIRSHANLIAMVSPLLAGLLLGYSGIRALVHRLTASDVHSGARLKAVRQQLARLQHREKALEHELARGIGEDVLPRIKSLDKEIAKIRTQTIPAIEAADAQASSAISDLWTWIHKNVVIAGTDAFAGAVAVALATLGLGGLRCSTLGNMLSQRGCGLWSDLEGLLGLFADTFLLLNVCTLLPILETAVSDVADPLVVALTDVGAGLCSGGIGAPPALSVPALSLPASPGLVLSLP